MQRPLQRLLSCLAFAAALLALPGWARATLLPACEAREQLTRAPIEWVAPTILDDGDVCDAGSPEAQAHVEDWGDPRVAAMCDERGASVIAPQRILPMTDARIEVAPGCGADGSLPALGSGSEDSPTPSALPALAQHAVLAGELVVPPPSFVLAPDFPPVAGMARIGHPWGIDDPPRCA